MKTKRIRKPRTAEQKAKYAAQRAERRRNWTPEEREADRLKKLKYYARRTPEQIAEYRAKSAATFAAISPEEKERRKLLVIKRLAENPKAKARISYLNKLIYERRQRRPEMNLCAAVFTCNEPPIGKQKFCLYHWCQSIRAAERRAKPQFTVLDLVNLWKLQEGKCIISGKLLIPGEDASLDHILPICRGGTSTIDNLRFIHSALNNCKWDQTDDEFKATLRLILPPLYEWAKKHLTA